jgi:cytochrome b-561
MLTFRKIYLITEIVGVFVVVLTISWVVVFMELVWDLENIKLYNWHSIFMVIGMVFLNGNCKLILFTALKLNKFSFFKAILVFRAFKSVSKMRIKVIHAISHVTSIVLITLGLAVEFISHYQHGEKDFYSLHSWLGMFTIIIFVGQFVFGFISYFFSLFSKKVKEFYLKIHVFFGIFCFISAIATCIIGFNQTARFKKSYSQYSIEGVLINFIGLLMVVYGCLVVFLVTKANQKVVTGQTTDG